MDTRAPDKRTQLNRRSPPSTRAAQVASRRPHPARPHACQPLAGGRDSGAHRPRGGSADQADPDSGLTREPRGPNSNSYPDDRWPEPWTQTARRSGWFLRGRAAHAARFARVRTGALPGSLAQPTRARASGHRPLDRSLACPCEPRVGEVVAVRVSGALCAGAGGGRKVAVRCGG
ncbi:hypothetical protein PAHAL_9G587700 [Panicum hallii]|uniref:Uncharacterized protein n=1 Tax=Panicum hallii TaxID=206008 RepID=A0A2S3ITT8_9POAL|nr:hypothetical protein PAHAL_9G587700 [Panicum hallii]